METAKTPKRNKYILSKILSMVITGIMTVLTLTVSCFASGGETQSSLSSAITQIGTALTGVIGYMSQTTAAIMGDNLWLLGMGFFVILFIAGFVMYLFRVGRR